MVFFIFLEKRHVLVALSFKGVCTAAATKAADDALPRIKN